MATAEPGPSQLLCEFLEVAVHTILKLRLVYPAEIFEKSKKHELPVWKSRFPDLNKYIEQCTRNLDPLVKDGSIKQVILTIKKASDGKAVCAYAFRFRYNEATAERASTALVDLGESMRRMMAKLITESDPIHTDDPAALTFALLVETNEVLSNNDRLVNDPEFSFANEWEAANHAREVPVMNEVRPLGSTQTGQVDVEIVVWDLRENQSSNLPLPSGLGSAST